MGLANEVLMVLLFILIGFLALVQRLFELIHFKWAVNKLDNLINRLIWGKCGGPPSFL